jgi:hypothetical protein
MLLQKKYEQKTASVNATKSNMEKIEREKKYFESLNHECFIKETETITGKKIALFCTIKKLK